MEPQIVQIDTVHGGCRWIWDIGGIQLRPRRGARPWNLVESLINHRDLDCRNGYIGLLLRNVGDKWCVQCGSVCIRCRGSTGFHFVFLTNDFCDGMIKIEHYGTANMRCPHN